jgi:hypothetical protein
MQQEHRGPTGRQKTAMTSPVAKEAKEIARQGTEQAMAMGQTAKERALYEVNSQRERFAGQIEKLAGAIEEQGGDEAATPILNLAASAARSLSSTLRNRSAEDLVAGVTRNPVAVLAGSFALGFFAVRLFKA